MADIGYDFPPLLLPYLICMCRRMASRGCVRGRGKSRVVCNTYFVNMDAASVSSGSTQRERILAGCLHVSRRDLRLLIYNHRNGADNLMTAVGSIADHLLADDRLSLTLS